MRKIIFTPTLILIISLILLFFFFFKIGTGVGGAPAKINLDYLTIYEIGASHTPGGDKSGGSQVCQVGGGNLDSNCTVGLPCTCDAQVQEGYYYRIEFQIANDGAVADSFSGLYGNLGNLNGTVDSDNDIWVTDGGSDETCSNFTWLGSQVEWVADDPGCDLNLSGAEVGQMKFIIQIGPGASETSNGNLYAQEDTSGDNLEGVVEISVAAVATVSCSTASGSTAFGTLTSGAVATSLPNATTTMTCSGTASGCTLYVKDAGDTSDPGLATTSPAYLIPSPNAAYDASTTLSAGTEGYGIQATTTAAGLTIAARYLLTGDDAGGLTLTNQIIASSSADISGAEVIVTHKAAISQTTPIGQYEDTITYECVIN